MAPRVAPPDPPPTDGVVAMRQLRAEDAPAVAATCQDPEVTRWMPTIPVPYGEKDARAAILTALKGWHEATGYEFAIAEAATGVYLGSVAVFAGANPRRWAIGYLVAPEARGRGVATRAVKLASRWAFATFEIERLALSTLPGNLASQRVAEKAGFHYEGVMRNWDVGRDGAPTDVAMFSLTPEDLAMPEDMTETAGSDLTTSDLPASPPSSLPAREAPPPHPEESTPS